MLAHLRSGDDDQMRRGERHFRHAVFELQVLSRVVDDVQHGQRVRLLLPHLEVAAGDLAVHELPEEHRARARARGDLRRVRRPRQRHQRAHLRRLTRVRPASLVAQPQHVEGADGKVATVWRPGDAGDRVLISGGGVELPAVGVPHAVLAVLSAGDDQVVDGVPLGREHRRVVRFPHRLLRRRCERPDDLRAEGGRGMRGRDALREGEGGRKSDALSDRVPCTAGAGQ